MTPSEVLALYVVGLGCLGFAWGGVTRALGLDDAASAALGVALALAIGCWFNPRYHAYRRAWRP
jgi:hypothetical protein